MVFGVIVLAFAGLVTAFYYWMRERYNYWKRQGIPYIASSFPFGNMKDTDVKLPLGKVHQSFYNEMKSKGPCFGIFTFWKPTLLVTDLDLAKNILIKDFQYFQDRAIADAASNSPLSHHLIFLTGQRWKSLRQKLSPTFTSGKMKFMFPTIVKISHEFEKTLSQLVKEDPVFEMKEVLARFTTDIIGECAFGIECNSLKDPNAEFRQMGQKLFGSAKRISFFRFMNETYPKMFSKIVGFLRPTQAEVNTFFIKTVKETVKYRDDNKIRRNDFLDILLQLRDNKEMGGITFEEIASQVFLFFIAGFETSSTTVSSALFELAHHQDVQNRLREEIVSTLERHDNKMTYEAVGDMHYLDQVIKETLRIHPPVSTLRRYCLRDYKVPDTKYTIEKGIDVGIPVYAIHRDPEIYPDPEKFDPERFEPSVAKSRHPAAFLSFGDGPRNCIGERFGIMQSKIAMVTLIKNFRLNTSEKSRNYPMEIAKDSPINTINGGLWLRLEKL